MGFAFNPFTGNFDVKGAGGGGGSSYIDGEVQNFSALPETLGTPAVDSAYLVREPEGTWLLGRKPAGIYIRTANTGTRAADWTYAGAFPDVFNDANFLLYDNADSTKNLQFQLSGITTGTTRTLTAPDASGTIALTGDLATVATSGDYDDLSDKPTIPTASTATPSALGVAAAGTSTDFARADHVHSMPDVSDLADVTLTDPQNDDALFYDEGSWINRPFAAVASESIGPADIGAAPSTGIDPTAITGTAVVDSDARLSDARTPTAHTHGNLTNDGKVGTTAGLPVVTTTDGAVTTLALGTAGQVLQVNSGATGVEFAAASGGGGEVRSDFVSPYTYIGLANAGTSESTASWLIRRSEFDAGGTYVSTTTATAVEWDDRLTASYT